MNYALEENFLTTFNAISKARNDVSLFVTKAGWKTLRVDDKTKTKWFSSKLNTLRLFLSVCVLNKKDVLFTQVSNRTLKRLLILKRIFRFKLVFLIHDLYSLRYSEKESRKKHRREIEDDICMLSQCDYVIAHNTKMIERLMQNGCHSKLISLDIFDYSFVGTILNRSHKDGDVWKVAYAGSTKKSIFLKYLDQNSHDYDFHLYGGPKMLFNTFNYHGSVDPDLLPQIIEGHFGLIWEGNENITKEDNYTCLNNPHKLSMYIVAGMPVIAWKESAAAEFIIRNKCGFVINKLDDIDQKLSEIKSDDYNQMVCQCLKLRSTLIHGEHIMSALNQCR